MAKKRKGKRTNKKKVCKKGFQCGRTCINRDRTCFSNLGKDGKKIVENYAQFVKRIADDKAKSPAPPAAPTPVVKPTVAPQVTQPAASTPSNENRLRERQNTEFSIEESSNPANVGMPVAVASRNVSFRQQPTEQQRQKAQEIAGILNEIGTNWVYPPMKQTGAREFEILGDPTLALASQLSNNDVIMGISVPDVPEVENSIRASQSAITPSRETSAGKIQGGRSNVDDDVGDAIAISPKRISFPNGISTEQETKAQEIAQAIKESGSNWMYAPFVKTGLLDMSAVGDPTTLRAAQLAGEDVTFGYPVPNDPAVIQQIERIQAILAR